jgi:hypothetical protein
VKEFDTSVPLFFNDGTPIEAPLFQQLQASLLDNFDGLTYFPQHNKGYWKMGDIVYQDEIVIYRVLSRKAAKSRRILSNLKQWMKNTFGQEEILIIERDVDIVD